MLVYNTLRVFLLALLNKQWRHHRCMEWIAAFEGSPVATSILSFCMSFLAIRFHLTQGERIVQLVDVWIGTCLEERGYLERYFSNC